MGSQSALRNLTWSSSVAKYSMTDFNHDPVAVDHGQQLFLWRGGYLLVCLGSLCGSPCCCVFLNVMEYHSNLFFPRTPSPPVLLEPLGLVPSQGTWRQIPRRRCSCPCFTTLSLTLSKGPSFRACYNLLQLLCCELDDSLWLLIWHPRCQCEVASLNLSLFTGFAARRVLLFPHLLLGSGFPVNNQLFPLCFIRLTYLNTSIPPGSLIQGRLHILHLPTLQSQQPALDILHQKNLHIPRQICKDVNHILCLLHDLQLLLTVLLVHLRPQHLSARGKAII